MNKIEQLKQQKQGLVFKLTGTWSLNEYVKIKKEIEAIDAKIERNTFMNYSMIVKIKERIDELETKKAKIMLEKNKTGNINSYRRLASSIELIEQAIELNKVMLTKAKMQ